MSEGFETKTTASADNGVNLYEQAATIANALHMVEEQVGIPHTYTLILDNDFHLLLLIVVVVSRVRESQHTCISCPSHCFFINIM